MKAKRFLSNENIKKEKAKIRNEIKTNFITYGQAKPKQNSGIQKPHDRALFVNEKGELIEQLESDEEEQDVDDSDFEDVDDEDEEEQSNEPSEEEKISSI